MILELYLIDFKEINIGTFYKKQKCQEKIKLFDKKNMKNFLHEGIYLYVVEVDLNDDKICFKKKKKYTILIKYL
ncbi:hypothetical protein QJ854_gp660 [Moumouvirus goulette]|uniref:Repeat protein n=1 Tax=Moumouvirus goulette TaxID=1247379 RepID=M1PWJ2_9VIRU|nr:hypothetical protein QJ854_gp660 [Moumouvirus goulette]AGF85122.1 hypothetical protein glt_00313 [Moumouvirus goulette]